MEQTSATIRHLDAINTSDLTELMGDSPLEFLHNLGQPTWVTIPGVDQSRSRAVVTLLHANEPSGLKAIYELLKSGIKPQTNLGILIVSVEAALKIPAFSHRYLPGERDMNRCFGMSDETNQAQLADQIVDVLRGFGPEAVIDTHNTSGHSEVFAVATQDTTAIHQVCQLFTHKLVVINQAMGTLIEQDLGCPVVTVEFGGFLDPNADQAARTSLEQFITRPHLFTTEPEFIKVLANPYRLEIEANCQLQYASTVDDQAGITIFNTIDQLNFRTLDANSAIGWIDHTNIQNLIVCDGEDNNLATEFFQTNEGILTTKTAMTIFMATTDSHIAKNDCLLYLCPEEIE